MQVRRRRAASRGPSALRSAPAWTPWSAAATSTSRPCPGASPRTSPSCECRVEGLPSSSTTLLQGFWGQGAPLSCLGARGPCQALPQHGAEPSAASEPPGLVCKGLLSQRRVPSSLPRARAVHMHMHATPSHPCSVSHPPPLPTSSSLALALRVLAAAHAGGGCVKAAHVCLTHTAGELPPGTPVWGPWVCKCVCVPAPRQPGGS